MKATICPIGIETTALRGWILAKIENVITSTQPERLAGNMVGRLCGIGIKIWLIGITIPAATYWSIALIAVMIVVLMIAKRRRSPVSVLERTALLTRSSIISAIGTRIPIKSVRQWFSTAMGLRFSLQLTGWFGKFAVMVAIALLNGTEIGIQHGAILILYPALAYISAKG